MERSEPVGELLTLVLGPGWAVGGTMGGSAARAGSWSGWMLRVWAWVLTGWDAAMAT
jgi:hypothetical protein